MAGTAIPSPNPLVTDVKLSIIKPLQKTAHVESIDPTASDLAFSDSYVATLHAYRLADKSEDAYMELRNRMRDSLRKVLVPFFSFAGRWIASTPPEGSSIGRRKLLCNDEGVPFIEAYVDKDLDSIVHASVAFRAVPELHGYGVLGMDVAQIQQRMPSDGLPCIFAQFTRFKCGGVVLAVNFNHMHTDAKGFYDFMTAWSDLSRTNETTVKVDHNRALGEIASLRDLLLYLDIARAHPTTASTNETVQDHSDWSRTMGPWPMRAFEVSPSTIKSLKQEAKENRNGPGFVSTGDCIAAHFWKSLARLPSSMLDGKEIVIQLVAEGRSKFFDPPLPELCGNHIAPVLLNKIPIKELQEMPLVSGACKVREQLQSTSREDWVGMPKWAEFLETMFSSKCAVMPVTSWFTFPMYEMDFGAGKPFFAARVNNSWSPNQIGTTSIEPPIPGSVSSIATVRVWSTLEVLQIFESDPLFVSFFKLENLLKAQHLPYA